jgi:hypothetical protein
LREEIGYANEFYLSNFRKFCLLVFSCDKNSKNYLGELPKKPGKEKETRN